MTSTLDRVYRVLPFALALTALACKPKAPEGTTPPEEGDGASTDDGGGKRAKHKKKDKGGDEGGGGKDGGEDAAPVTKACPAEVSDTPTALWGNQLFIRTPKNVELIEENEFLATTRGDFVSTCEAMIDRMMVFTRPDDPAKDLKAIRDELMVQMQYSGGTWLDPEKDDKNDLRAVGEFPPSGGQPAAKMYYRATRKYGRIFMFIYVSQPDQWLGVYESFKLSADRAIIPPPGANIGG